MAEGPEHAGPVEGSWQGLVGCASLPVLEVGSTRASRWPQEFGRIDKGAGAATAFLPLAQPQFLFMALCTLGKHHLMEPQFPHLGKHFHGAVWTILEHHHVQAEPSTCGRNESERGPLGSENF